MSKPFSAKKWVHIVKVRYQPTQGHNGLYRDPRPLLAELFANKYWCEEAVWRNNSKANTPVL